MNLFECIDMIDGLLSIPENKKVKEMLLKNELNQTSRHLKLGQWVRNNCKMWTDGFDDINKDILRINQAFGADYELYDNPDDVSGVILDIYVDLKAKRFGEIPLKSER